MEFLPKARPMGQKTSSDVYIVSITEGRAASVNTQEENKRVSKCPFAHGAEQIVRSAARQMGHSVCFIAKARAVNSTHSVHKRTLLTWLTLRA